jgi:ABC-type antimicrobial peptide transport system, ATPase component
LIAIVASTLAALIPARNTSKLNPIEVIKMAKILRLKNINKVYGDKIKTQVLFDINLDFEESTFNSIIGESGSGKIHFNEYLGYSR